MKKLITFIIIASLSPVAHACPVSHDTIMQYSLFDGLVNSVFDGDMTVKELRPYGDFGLGTYNGIDGEMIVLNKVFYQAHADGSVTIAKDNAQTPFAMMTFFDADKTLQAKAGADMDAMNRQIDDAIQPDGNDFYAIRIDGMFKQLKLRAPRAQKKPYPPLKQVLETQAVFDLKNIEGTLVGFKSPPFARGINVPGYHFHFISKDRKAGGHVLALEVTHATITLDKSPDWLIRLPQHNDFQHVDFSGDNCAAAQSAVHTH